MSERLKRIASQVAPSWRNRLGRSLSHLVQLLGEFSAHKVALIVPGQGINTSSSNPASALLLNMLGAIGSSNTQSSLSVSTLD